MNKISILLSYCKYTRSMLILLKMLILLFCRPSPFHYAKKQDKTKRNVWSLKYHTQWELKDKVSKRQMCMPKYQGAIHKNVSLAFSHTYQTCNAPRKYVLQVEVLYYQKLYCHSLTNMKTVLNSSIFLFQ